MSYTAEIIGVGTELLLGNIANTDAQVISQGLSALGINVYYHTVVGDNPERLKKALNIAKNRADIIITTGGLGPTYDDLTKQTLAEAFGKKLVMHEPSAERIRSYFRQNPNRVMTENNFRQAMLPEGCAIFDNDWGTAPGCAFLAEETYVIMLPGPPRECTSMFQHCIVPFLKTLSDAAIFSRSIRIFGMGEPMVEQKLQAFMTTMENPTLAPYAKEGEVMLRVTAKAQTMAEAREMTGPVIDWVKSTLGDVVYGLDVDSLEETVLQLLAQQGKTLSAAESCTGGLFSKRMTDLPGASKVFKGGIVSYSNEAKKSLLSVPSQLLAEKGAVSAEAALSMASGARKALDTDLAVGITGVAGPEPDERNTPVGRVYIALAAPEGEWVRSIQIGRDRRWIRNLAAHHGFDMVRRYLTGLDLSLEEK
ncbi:MAG: competence/damage-inducible protein A [Oscillospiraceae bacterium]|nr:competence/damage-inducible protein A [Oscillospiraceae bacterium]